jgi:hypothetical protein
MINGDTLTGAIIDWDEEFGFAIVRIAHPSEDLLVVCGREFELARNKVSIGQHVKFKRDRNVAFNLAPLQASTESLDAEPPDRS